MAAGGWSVVTPEPGLVFPPRRDIRKVFQALRASMTILPSPWRRKCFRIAHPSLLTGSETFMATPITNAAGPDRPQRPALVGYSLLLAVLLASGLYALFISGPAMRRAAHDDLVRTITDEDRQFCETFGLRAASAAFMLAAGSWRSSVINKSTAITRLRKAFSSDFCSSGAPSRSSLMYLRQAISVPIPLVLLSNILSKGIKL
jgi:hypothetical protein